MATKSKSKSEAVPSKAGRSSGDNKTAKNRKATSTIDKPTGTKRTKTAATARAAEAARGAGKPKKQVAREPITSSSAGVKVDQPDQASVEEFLRDNPSSGKFPVDRRTPPLEELPADDKRRKEAAAAREKILKLADELGKVGGADPVTAGAIRTARRTLLS